MTVRNLFDELAAFLSSDNPQVLCISGKWGVGKTFAWNKALQKAKSDNTIALSKYAYVSLFGQRSLDDVRYAIFENTVPKANAGDEADLSSLQTSIKSAASGWRKGASLASIIPQTSNYAAGLSKLGFLTVRDQIVCIDDLERAGDGLRTKDVLGIISYLKERRRCKVVILLNDEALNGPDKQDYAAQLEKVADTVFRFEPTAAEAADIGIDTSSSFHEQLTSDVIKLGITNIRVIKKIENYGRKLEPLLEEYDHRILAQAIHSITLFSFSKFQPSDAPSIAFIKESNEYEAFLAAENPEGDAYAQWRATLSEFGFTHLDELDLALLAGVESGYFNPEQLTAAAKIAESRLKLVDQDNRFSAAWNKYHESFDDNCLEVINLLEEAVANCAPAISPMNLSGTVTLFKELGFSDRVPHLISSYISGRPNEPDLWDLDTYSFRGDVKDPDVQAAFDAQYEATSHPEDPISILIKIGSSSGWNPSDIVAAAKITEDELFSAFKTLRGPDLRRAVNGALKFQNIRGGDEYMHTLTSKAVKAMRRIGAESDINRRRVGKWGIKLDVQTQ
ncbi:MAG: P-loop NTPase fold protein [Pseudomonadota bacterium]